ncbi:MAG TPA: alcohol dehydrogenase catalytic domain-containing protein [bacterium]|nr:alcohol dehydrogenase catalytic domain-containing protein [bacterium]
MNDSSDNFISYNKFMMSYNKVVIEKLGGPEVLKLVEEKKIPGPKQGHLRIKVIHSSANFTNVMIRKGKYQDEKEKQPLSPGYDMVGIVDEIGPGANKFEVGQRVADMTVIGAYSENICLPVENLILVIENIIDFSEFLKFDKYVNLK